MIVVEYRPEEPGPLVTMHACWMADNGVETAVFVTQQEAVEFCVKRWGAPPARIIGSPTAVAEGAEDRGQTHTQNKENER
jgi:hypothetical protein